ncbi:hypothetical protein CAPN004_21730 [Capnocytophaga cynodegmi]|uniref:type II toxin-antitoxin system RelE/ParE family toxin n=1 Tax=Capnocytophaga cynodegmi TaxID=28189 RepID=UPI001AC403EA|nr:type II toxin-antitoxin system RelE/ParE family toxin [Capnocytophaga cynodegmi]GIM53143.1 hypothetical protein CAPN004_21730 [Capnocytophaga cynodegmi]
MEIVWSEQAKQDLKNILIFWRDYTGSNSYSQKIQKNIEEELFYITNFPAIYPYTDFNDIKRALILKNFSLFFYVNVDESEIRIIRFWDNRQDPEKLKDLL